MALKNLLADATPFLFFTGKGGVGKTSISAATALALAGMGKRVLLVSTDCASNLDEMLGVPLKNLPTPVPDVPGLDVLNIDPAAAAEAYRLRVLNQLAPGTPDEERQIVREQLSGACTTEIAAFDEFAGWLTGDASQYDHVIFDTAPSGHTLRLLSLPAAWSGFLAGNDRGASCLGPHSGLKTKEARFRQALAALVSPQQTTVVLVTLPDGAPMAEAARTAGELAAQGLTRQHLIINGVFHASLPDDVVATALERSGQRAIEHLPAALAELPFDTVPLLAIDTVGLAALRALNSDVPAVTGALPLSALLQRPGVSLASLSDELEEAGHGLIMVMGKGGVGKTTIAAALAVRLAKRGHQVLLTTTDPAAHLASTLSGEVAGLTLGRIDPAVETKRYIDEVMARKGATLDAEARALMLEDLQSPCTEEVAVFHAFTRVISEARRGFVVLDTAPTGHSLLLIDAAGAYHRQTMRDLPASFNHGQVTTPLMRLQDPKLTHVILVTLPETTPVSQAAALQEDLRRAQVEPFAWVVNRSFRASGTRDPLLAARLAGEDRQFARIARGLSERLSVLPWLPVEPIGVDALVALLGEPALPVSVGSDFAAEGISKAHAELSQPHS